MKIADSSAVIWREPRQKRHAAQVRWIVICGASLALALLPFIIRLDGRQRGEWLQFLGRFHPVLVHLPIGALVLLPLLEFAGLTRIAFRETAGFVLQLTVATCLITLASGLLLAHAGGVTGTIVTRHMLGGIALSIELLVCLVLRPDWASGHGQRIYPILLSITLLTLIWTAHQGGSLAYGRDYLTQYMPGSLRRLIPFGKPASDAAYAGSIYTRRIHPIFDARCVACHGASKQQAGLRLDFYDLLISGGRDGAVIKPRDPGASLLLRRVTLPAGDRHFMPAEGHTALTPVEIADIRAWIAAGASPNAVSVPGISNVEIAEPIQPVGDYSSLMNDLRAMQSSQGAKLVAVSANPADGLILNTLDAAASFDDAQLSRFGKFAPFIVEADLQRTAVTDASLETLRKFAHLRALHLEDTAITGRTLAQISGLSQLTYLNLSGTKVTSESLAPLKSMPNLRHIYLFNTPADPDSRQSNLRSAQ
ncbi:MAG: c-type cytochrome domain-containing protein [Candidatus Sulfotelmatobacter sp.]